MAEEQRTLDGKMIPEKTDRKQKSKTASVTVKGDGFTVRCNVGGRTAQNVVKAVIDTLRQEQ